MQGKFDDCRATLDAVEKRLTDALPVAQIRYLLERGRAFNSANLPSEAKPLFRAAWEKAGEAKDTGYAIDAAHMLAIVEADPNAQMQWNLNAMRCAEQDPAQRRWLPSVLNNLGEAFRVLREYEKALDCFENRARWLRELGKEIDIYTKEDIARMNRLLGRLDAALSMIEPVALELKSNKQPDGYISAEYGQCLAAMGRSAEAAPYLVEACEKLSKDDYMIRYEPEELRTLERLAGI